jgi:hypothetical protein
MNPSLFAAIAAACLAALWLGSRRRPRPFLRSDNTSAVAALNRAQIAQLLEPQPTPASILDGLVAPSAPLGSLVDLPSGLPGDPRVFRPTLRVLPPAGAVRQRLALLRQLECWGQGGGPERLQAMAVARLWRHPCVLPLLRRGLRDPDPLVMAEAAAAMQMLRGRSPGTGLQASRPAINSRPRRVLRTR